MKCPSAPSTCACALAVTIAIPLWIPASAGRGPLQAPHGANGWTIEHIAGGGPDGLPADLANLNDPTRLAAGDDGEFYVVARGDKRVYRISASGIIEPLAGSGADDMDGLLTEPVEVAHGGGTIFIGDVASRILSRDPSSGVVTVFDTSDTGGRNVLPLWIAVGPAGDLFYTSESQSQRLVGRIEPGTGATSVYVGSECLVTSCTGSGDGGPAASGRLVALLHRPTRGDRADARRYVARAL